MSPARPAEGARPPPDGAARSADGAPASGATPGAVLPRPTALTQPFWAAANAGRLLLQVDDASGRAQFFPRPLGPEGDASWHWAEAAGGGTLVAMTSCAVPAAGFEADVPYLMGLVRLDEGPRVLARIANARLADLRVGQRMRLTWSTRLPGQQVYQFEPAG